MPKKNDSASKRADKSTATKPTSATPQVDLEVLKGVLEEDVIQAVGPEPAPIADAVVQVPDGADAADASTVIAAEVPDADPLEAIAMTVPEPAPKPQHKDAPKTERPKSRLTWREMMGYDWNGQIFE